MSLALTNFVCTLLSILCMYFSIVSSFCSIWIFYFHCSKLASLWSEIAIWIFVLTLHLVTHRPITQCKWFRSYYFLNLYYSVCLSLLWIRLFSQETNIGVSLALVISHFFPFPQEFCRNEALNVNKQHVAVPHSKCDMFDVRELQVAVNSIFWQFLHSYAEGKFFLFFCMGQLRVWQKWKKNF